MFESKLSFHETTRHNSPHTLFKLDSSRIVGEYENMLEPVIMDILMVIVFYFIGVHLNRKTEIRERRIYRYKTALPVL